MYVIFIGLDYVKVESKWRIKSNFIAFSENLTFKGTYYQKKLTFSVTVSDTSDTFLVATSVNFQPTSATLLVNFEAPKENADQLWKKKKGKEMNDIF